MKRVEIVAPSGNVINMEDITRCASLFISRDWEVELGPTIYSSHQRFAGETDRDRLNNFNKACCDKKNSLVLCARGGYGMNRILPYIDFEGIKKAGTWVAGFSDITLFGLAYLAKCGGMSFHSPTASILGKKDVDPWTVDEFFQAVSSKNYTVSFSTSHADFHGKGILWGGNLSILVSLIGTEYMPKIEKGILFVEDVAEPFYKVERDLIHLKQAGILDAQTALVLGSFSEMRRSSHDFGYSFDDVERYISSITKVPVIPGLPFGHTNRTATLVMGSKAELFVRKEVAFLDILESAGI